MLKTFNHAPLTHPVILIIDNDDGAADIFKIARNNGAPSISHTSTEPFYHLFANLYLVKTPEISGISKSRIEDLFDPELFKTIIDGKTFDPDKEHGAADKYSKLVFAEKVIAANAGTIDFSKFAQLLDRIVAALENYAARLVAQRVKVTSS